MIVAFLATALAVAAAQDVSSTHDQDNARRVREIFAARCIKCHGPEKQRARLRLDQRESVIRESDEMWIVRPGKAEESELYRRITLPADEFDRMPSGGDPLTREQIEVIRAWIEGGASWPPAVASEPGVRKRSTDRIGIRALTDAQRARVQTTLRKLRERGALAMRVSAGSEAIEVSFKLLGQRIGDDDLALLNGLEPVLVQLNLARTAITSGGARRLKRFGELRRLHLEQTAIDDHALAGLAGLEKLEYLNLYGTAVSDGGLEDLKRLGGLRRLYLWKTRVSPKAIEELRSAIADVVVNFGEFEMPTSKPASAPDESPRTCCELAKTAGGTCDHPCCVEAAGRGEICRKCNPDTP